MRKFYHYGNSKDIASISSKGMFNQSSYAPEGNMDPHKARQLYGIPLPDMVYVFEDDGKFTPMKPMIVSSSNRFDGGGIQYTHPGNPKPVTFYPIVVIKK